MGNRLAMVDPAAGVQGPSPAGAEEVWGGPPRPRPAAVVAVATLVVAAAFRPLLKRVQQRVDRRFNRERVDGDRSVEEFGARLRDQTDADDVVVDLVDVVSRT